MTNNPERVKFHLDSMHDGLAQNFLQKWAIHKGKGYLQMIRLMLDEYLEVPLPYDIGAEEELDALQPFVMTAQITTPTTKELPGEGWQVDQHGILGFTPTTTPTEYTIETRQHTPRCPMMSVHLDDNMSPKITIQAERESRTVQYVCMRAIRTYELRRNSALPHTND